MSPENLAVGIAVVFAVLFLWGFLQRRPDEAAVLKTKYVALARLGPVEGRAQLAERLEALSQRFPGHTDIWYLRWLVRDLERAKR